MLELVAKGVSLHEVLDALTAGIESMAPGCLCSILLLDDTGRLRIGASGRLPAQYMQQVDGLPIGPDVGSCGSAAFRNETIIVEDIATDYRWAAAKELPLGFGLRACWSVPIRDPNHRVLGTFAMYHRKPGSPKPGELSVVEAGAHLAGNAIVRLTSERRLKETVERLRLAEEAAGFGVWEMDVDSGEVTLSEGAAKVSGIPAGASKAQRSDLEARIHPDDRVVVKTVIDHAIQNGHDHEVEFRVPMPDGTLRWCRSRGSFQPTDGGRRRVVGSIVDITREKVMIQQLRDSAERMKLAEQAAHFGIWEDDLTTDTITISGGLVSLFGGRTRSSRRFPAKKFASLLRPDHLSALNAAIARAVSDRQPFHVEIETPLRDGSTRWHRIQGRAEFAGEHPKRIIGAAIDITREKRMQHSLEQARLKAEAAVQARREIEKANAELAAIVECAGNAIISQDLAGNVLTWNRGAERIYGFSSAEMIGNSMAMLIPSGRVEEDLALMERVRNGEGTEHLETTRLTKSNGLIHILLTVSPIRDQQGNVIGAAHVAWDVTHLKQLERQIAHVQKLESIGQLAAGIAHEINTPIQYIGDNGKFLEEAFRDLLLYAEACGRRQAQLPVSSERDDPARDPLEEDLDYFREEIPKAIEHLLHGVEQVARIVGAMKEFSHPGPLEKIPVDINRGIESTILVSRNEWKYIADVTTDFDPELPPVPCLAGDFNQVILNLIVNAAHAIAEVRKDSDPKGSIHITTRKYDGYAEIRVSDTGCGIPQAIQSKVFDPFFTTKPVGKGTGQGLALAHSVIVQKHKGRIRLESQPGRGTTFIIQLPLEHDPAEASTVTSL